MRINYRLLYDEDNWRRGNEIYVHTGDFELRNIACHNYNTTPQKVKNLYSFDYRENDDELTSYSYVHETNKRTDEFPTVLKEIKIDWKQNKHYNNHCQSKQASN